MKARGPLLVVVLSLVAPALWLTTGAATGRFATPTTSLMSLGALFGLAGASVFAVNLILGARFQVMDALFGGLDKLYRFHRRNGEAAIALLVCHAALMFASRATISASTALALISPAGGWTQFLGVVALVLALGVLAFTLLARLGHEVFVYVHRFFGGAFLVAIFHIFGSPDLRASQPLTLYLGALSAAALLAWGYRSLFASFLVRRYEYAVAEVDRLDPTVVAIGMQPIGRRLHYIPGQFIFVTFYSSKFEAQFHPVSVASQGGSAIITLRPGEARDQFHPFSLTSAPQQPGLSVAIKAVGDFTAALHELNIGAIARVEGPYGGFSYLKTRNPKQVWIAGGIGITPFVGMARSLEPSGRSIDLFYGFKSRAQGYFGDELAALADGVEDFRFFPVPEDERGFITTDLIARHSGALAARDFFICGPPGMIDNMRRQLAAAGVRARRIHYEKFALGGPRA